MFGTAEGRLQFMELYRKNWESLHCQLGFKKVVLSKGILSLGDKAYDLHCPLTPAERAAASEVRVAEAVGLQGDLQKEGLKIVVQAQGTGKDRLGILGDLFQARSDRDVFFQRIRPSIEDKMCGQGFKAIRLETPGNKPQYTDYRLSCAGVE